jgi:hypothetical protein
VSAASSSSADADIDRSTETLSSSLRSEEWEGQLWQALAQEPEARLGRRIIVVPDAATALAVQWACSNATDDDRRSPRCLTARYVV